MPLFWVMLWSTLCHLALLSDLDHCTIQENHSPQTVSSLLESLECLNDYKSYIQCTWKEAPHINTPLQLMIKVGEQKSKPCVPYGEPVQDADKHRIVTCRLKNKAFSIGIEYTVFFSKTQALCSSFQHKHLHLSQHLRAHPPVNLSIQDSDDGSWQLIWSNPYPSSSSLSKNLKYQLSYRSDRQDSWTIKDVTNTNMKLDKRSMFPGYRYEARVRARASVGQWSDWSPVVTWNWTWTVEDAVSTLHCVLDGEKEVMCSWEVSEELTHFITYQLYCNHSATSEGCCVNQTVTHDLSGSVQRYSCSLNVTDPAHLLLELKPTRNAKTFKSHQNIIPSPPKQVTVNKEGKNWIVEWAKPGGDSKYDLSYEVCYYMKQHQAPCESRNLSEGSMSLIIPSAFLIPSQQYQVKVRSLIVPGQGSEYKGIPSNWTDPVDWTSHAASRTFINLIYVFISGFVTIVFCTFYYIIPACQRRVVVWVESVPSPGKSKILSEIKSATSRSLMQSENTYICKVLNLDSLSTCSSDVSLWPTKDTDKKHLEQYRDCWNCDNLLSPAEKVNGSDTSSMSFSGPYIFCQTPEPNCNSAEDKCEEKREKKEETSSHDTASAPPVNFTLYGEGYVCLPNRSTSRSTQDLVSHSDANTSTHRHDNAEQDQQCPESTSKSDKVDIQLDLSEPTGGLQPPAQTSGPFTSWPQGSTRHASGYCLLPTDFTKAAQ